MVKNNVIAGDSAAIWLIAGKIDFVEPAFQAAVASLQTEADRNDEKSLNLLAVRREDEGVCYSSLSFYLYGSIKI